MYRRFLNLLVLAGLAWGAGAVPSSAADVPSSILPPDEVKPVEREHRRVALQSNQDAWRRLPNALQGAGQPLPTWARALAETLPRTTAAMLELDYLHRARGPLDAKLRGKLRWVAAHAHRCAYSEACATADLLRAGLDPAEIATLAGDLHGFSARERAVLTFARTLAQAADRLTDTEVAELVHDLGEKQVVAIVLLLAYANFQDRLFLALDLPPEAGQALEPVEVRFQQPALGASRAGPTRAVPAERPSLARSPAVRDGDGLAQDFAQLRQALEKQRNRKPRIALPQGGPLEVRWGQVCRLYQPELAAAWSACSSAFEQEADQDPTFAAHLFWVMTQVQHCYY